MFIDSAFYEMRIDTFLAKDPIPPYENREIEKTEEEKDRLCKHIIDGMYETVELPD